MAVMPVGLDRRSLACAERAGRAGDAAHGRNTLYGKEFGRGRERANHNTQGGGGGNTEMILFVFSFIFVESSVVFLMFLQRSDF